MKCIKEECRYCEPDMFKASVLECTVVNRFCKFKRTSDMDCVIGEAIDYHKQKADYLEEYKKLIEGDKS